MSINWFTAWLGAQGKPPAQRKSIEYKNYPGVKDHICRSDYADNRTCDRCFAPLPGIDRTIVINEKAHGTD